MGECKGKKGTVGRPVIKRSRKTKSCGPTIKTILDANAIANSSTLKEAYMKRHPNSSEDSAAKNCGRMATPEVEEVLKNYLKTGKAIDVNKETIVKLCSHILEGYLTGQDQRAKTADFLKATSMLKELVADFKQRHEVDDLTGKSEEELNSRLDNLLGKN